MEATRENDINLNINKNINNNNLSNHVILAVDIGTTNLKCSLYDDNLEILHSCSTKLKILQPREGYEEIDPNYLLDLIKRDIKKCAENKPSSYIIKSFGISTQRNSITLWNKKTGEHYSNIILWSDRRPIDVCESMNSGIILNTIVGACKIASVVGTSITGHRIKSLSKYKVETKHIAPKLISQLNILENKLQPKEMENILYGTIETWLLWNLSKENTFATDMTCASSTGMYDMYHRKWSPVLGVSLSVPIKILPKVCDTCGDFGNLKNEILELGYDVPITAVIADSQSSVIAECAFEPGDCVITIGTGSFISINIGSKPMSSNYDYHPLVTYKYRNKEMFILHAGVSSAGVAIEWAKSIGLFNDYKEMNDLLNSTENSGGVYFISAFGYMDMNGVDKDRVGTGFVGIKTSTTKAQMLRAVIDSIVITIKLKFDCLLKDLKSNKIPLKSIRVSGGVAQSDFLCQYLANLLDYTIEKSDVSSSTSLYGAAFLSGIGAKIWNQVEDLTKYRRNVKYFKPNTINETVNNFYNKNDINKWCDALKIYTDWYKPQ